MPGTSLRFSPCSGRPRSSGTCAEPPSTAPYCRRPRGPLPWRCSLWCSISRGMSRFRPRRMASTRMWARAPSPAMPSSSSGCCSPPLVLSPVRDCGTGHRWRPLTRSHWRSGCRHSSRLEGLSVHPCHCCGAVQEVKEIGFASIKTCCNMRKAFELVETSLEPDSEYVAPKSYAISCFFSLAARDNDFDVEVANSCSSTVLRP